MHKSLLAHLRLSLMVPAIALMVGTVASTARAQSPLYNPIPMPANNQVTDTLTNKDIPTGFGGFARDYVVSFQQGDQVVIDLTSDQFDTIVTLIGPDGATVSENDDGPDGTTNSLLFARITRPGSYIIRVRPYGGQGGQPAPSPEPGADARPSTPQRQGAQGGQPTAQATPPASAIGTIGRFTLKVTRLRPA
jgi:hypothetical protein